jgi:hypothetical protein
MGKFKCFAARLLDLQKKNPWNWGLFIPKTSQKNVGSKEILIKKK